MTHLPHGAHSDLRLGRVAPPRPVEWLHATGTSDCHRCPTQIALGEPIAWLPKSGEFVCIDCGCTADDKADEGTPVDDSALPLCEREDGAA